MCQLLSIYTNELSGDPVDGNEFLAVCKEIFPDATLSVGWTTGPEVSIFNPNYVSVYFRANILKATLTICGISYLITV